MNGILTVVVLAAVGALTLVAVMSKLAQVRAPLIGGAT
jgi:hypothetical protein